LTVISRKRVIWPPRNFRERSGKEEIKKGLFLGSAQTSQQRGEEGSWPSMGRSSGKGHLSMKNGLRKKWEEKLKKHQLRMEDRYDE